MGEYDFEISKRPDHSIRRITNKIYVRSPLIVALSIEKIPLNGTLLKIHFSELYFLKLNVIKVLIFNRIVCFTDGNKIYFTIYNIILTTKIAYQ